MDYHEIILLVICGFLAGVINTLAGSGSLFTLPVLIFMGLPAGIANGTNRVGILLQTLVGAFTLYKGGGLKLKGDVKFIIPTVAGSVIGALIAVNLPEGLMRTMIGVVMLILFIILVVNYSKIIREHEASGAGGNWILVWFLLFLIGIYGGFIQLGLGLFTLSALILIMNMTFTHANALKNMMNFFLTIPAFLVFAFNGQIKWEFGLILASGQATGAWVAARFSLRNKGASEWIRWLLIVMTLLSALELLGARSFAGI